MHNINIMYILINKNDLYSSQIYKSKQQICEYIGIHRNTLNKIPYSNNNYIVLYCDPVLNKQRCNIKR